VVLALLLDLNSTCSQLTSLAVEFDTLLEKIDLKM
jgi:hypothetical protein